MKIIMLTLLLMFSLTYVYSDYMQIELASGTSASFNLNEIEQLTFSEVQLSVQIASGVQELFDIEDIVQITFSENVSIDDTVKFISQIPIEFLKNHPNPFNPETTISFVTNVSGYTKVVVYNPKGQRVRTLLSKELDAGHHSFLWDGKNEQGKPVSSGVYMYKVSVDGLQKIDKMLLLK